MKVLSIRFCTVSPEAASLEGCFGAMGVQQMDQIGVLPAPVDDSFGGAIFTASESGIEVLPEGPGMSAGTMLQIMVGDADTLAAPARQNGLNPEGPMDAHGVHIHSLKAPRGAAGRVPIGLVQGPGLSLCRVRPGQ